MRKTRISPNLATILRNPHARRKLRESINSGRPIVVQIRGKKYRISTRSLTKIGGYLQ